MDSRPNILCISLDSVRADEVSFLDGKLTTPNLEQLAGQSTVYLNAISPSTWTLPVHTSVFTGLYPPEHGVLDFNRELGDHPTLGQKLREAGYDTRAFFHNSWVEIGGGLRGFEMDQDGNRTTGPDLSGMKEYLAMILKRLRIDKPFYELYLYHNRPQEDERTVRAAADAIDDASDPFCFFVHLNDTHWKYFPPKTLEARFSDAGRFSLRWNQLYWQNRIFENKERYWTGAWKPRRNVSDRMRELYRATIFKADSLVGTLISALEQRGILDETIVVVFSDHGDNFGEDGLYGHHFSVSNALVRVPLVIHDPTDTLEPGTVDIPVQLNDVFPTILQLCGIRPPETNSVDLASESRDCAYVYYHLVDEAHVDESIPEARRNQTPPRRQYAAWESVERRAVWYPDEETFDGPIELYKILRSHYESLDVSIEALKQTLDAATKEQLKNMGYL